MELKQGTTTDLISTLANNDSDIVVTSWSHGPATQDVEYAGGGSGTDAITLVFTAAQLEEILSNAGPQTALQTYLDGDIGTGDLLNLGGTSWNATVAGFGNAHLAVASGLTDYVVYSAIDSGGTDANLPDLLAELTGNDSDNTLVGTGAGETLTGNAGNDILVGGGGNDILNGGPSNDLLLGGDGNDALVGGAGRDIMVGGAGVDTFNFNATSESGATAATADVITDFTHGVDFIDLVGIDAVPAGADNAFLFGGQNVSVVQNSVTWFESGGNTVVQLDNTNDTTADMMITLSGVNLGLTVNDFHL